MIDIDFGKRKEKKIKIALVDDHALFRQGLRMILSNFTDLDVICEADHGKELIERMIKEEPDMIFMDINMPVMDGLKTTRKLRQHFPHIKIIALTMHDEKRFVIEMIKSGANGYLFKNAEPRELHSAIQQVLAAGFYFNDYMTEAMFNGWVNNKSTAKLLIKRNRFTKKDLLVLKLVCKQYTTDEIAAKLSLSTMTVMNYRRRLMARLKVRNTAGLVLCAIETGLVKLNPTKIV